MPTTPERKAVLIDDEQHVQTLMGSVLRSLGFEVVAQLANGDGAAEIVVREGATLVLLDVNMPGKSGIETIQELTTASDACAIMLTSVNDPEIIRACLAAGASHYILKSSSIDAMKTIIEQTWTAHYRDGSGVHG